MSKCSFMKTFDELQTFIFTLKTDCSWMLLLDNLLPHSAGLINLEDENVAGCLYLM